MSDDKDIFFMAGNKKIIFSPRCELLLSYISKNESIYRKDIEDIYTDIII